MIEVPIEQVKPSPYQLRLSFNVEDLKEEIRKDGLLSPLIVRRKGSFYELIDGQRRLTALKELGWKKASVEIQDVDDEKARLMVYKLNSIRESYSVEEEATYFKKLAEAGMRPYEIETELGVKHSWVQACLNIWKLPEDIRNNIFAPRGKTAYQVYMSDIRDLEGVINRNVDEAIAILRDITDKRLTAAEKQKLITDRSRKIDEARIKAVEEALPIIEPKVSKLETPEELEEVAVTLRREAKKKREEALTPEEKTERKRVQEEKRRIAEEDRKRREEEKEQRIEEEANRRARELEKTEKLRIEEEARKKVREEILSSPETMREMVAEVESRVGSQDTLEIQERARQSAEEILQPLKEAILKAEADIQEAESSEKRKLLQNYMVLGSILTLLRDKRVFCLDHPKEQPMLMWSCGISLSKTYDQLKERLRTS
jgi:ParB family chromosome partitioning protein